MENTAYHVEAMRIPNIGIVIVRYEQIYSNLEKPRLQYGSLQDVSPIDPNQAQQDVGYTSAYQKLVTDYKHFLRYNTVQEILVGINEKSGVATYNIVFDTRNGIFLGIADYNPTTKSSIIRALVLLDSSGLATKAADCSYFD